MAANHYDLIVIGSGSAGSSAWYNARQRGHRVAVFESDTLGGECPTYACVPTKALLHCAEVFSTVNDAARFGVKVSDVSLNYGRIKAWKDEVVSQTGAALGRKPYDDMGVQLVQHPARFIAEDTVEAGGETYSAERILIATGSRQRLPQIDGLAESGYLTFREAIDLESLPESIFILGGGAVGCEFSHLFRSFGSEVYIADHNPTLLKGEDPDAGALIASLFEQRGIHVLSGTEVSSVRMSGGRKKVTYSRDGVQTTVEVEQVLVATGKQPNVDGLNLEAAGVRFSDKGIEVDEHLRTSNPRIFAAGDVAGPFKFTHAASYQGLLALDNMFGENPRSVDYGAMPRCVFTEPEVAAVGLTPAQAQDRDITLQVGRSDIIDNDRGLTSGQREGFVKVYADSNGRLVGGVIVSSRAGEVLHELSLAIALGASAGQVAGLVHAFPTFSEALGAACAEIA